MDALSISRLIFDTVPQLYEAKNGPHPVDLRINGENARVYSLTPLSQDLIDYLEAAAKTWEELRPMTEGEISQIIEREWIQQKFVVTWLESQTQIRSWGKILDYARRLSRRLTEHQLNAKTIVIDAGEDVRGGVKLSDPDYLKVFDWLGSTSHTYFRVTENLRIKAYEALPAQDANDNGFRFYPDFLHPVISSLKDKNSVVVHVSENGSIIVANMDGLIASKRALESWTVYDIDHVLASVGEVFSPHLSFNACSAGGNSVACSLFQILFDVMMKMQGALIIIDDPNNLNNYLIKGIDRASNSPLASIFSDSTSDELLYTGAEVRKLVELSSIDGALVLDLHGTLQQIGSMVVAHPTTPNRFGTREAAGYSAAKNGATAFKISADGHMSMFFTTDDFTGSEVHRFDFR